MKILLGNTGRGGEQCIFSSIVHAYRSKVGPDAHIEVTTPPQYWSFWKNNKDISNWTPIKYEPGDPHEGDPVAALRAYFERHRRDFDVIEYPCESAVPFVSEGEPKSTLYKCYKNIVSPLFKLGEVQRKTFLYPTEDEVKTAREISKKYPRLLILSHGANSMQHPLSLKGYEKLASMLNEKWDVCYIGTSGENHMPADPPIQGANDLRDIGYGSVYSLAESMKLFIGMETAPTFMLAHSDAPMIIMRGDPQFPLENTGLTPMGFRKKENTHELEVLGMPDDEIIEIIQGVIR